MFNFDLSNGYVLLRLIVGLFLIPHGVAKITFRPGPLGFFTAAGYPNPGLFVNFGMDERKFMEKYVVLPAK